MKSYIKNNWRNIKIKKTKLISQTSKHTTKIKDCKICQLIMVDKLKILIKGK